MTLHRLFHTSNILYLLSCYLKHSQACENAVILLDKSYIFMTIHIKQVETKC
nr:MAG TPA: hypothetical protein [Caudoviricetes sp.]